MNIIKNKYANNCFINSSNIYIAIIDKNKYVSNSDTTSTKIMKKNNNVSHGFSNDSVDKMGRIIKK